MSKSDGSLTKLIVLKSAREIDRLSREAHQEEKMLLRQQASKGSLHSGHTIQLVMDIAVKTLDQTARAKYAAFKEVFDEAGLLTPARLREFGQDEAETYSKNAGIVAARINRKPATRTHLTTEALEKMIARQLDQLRVEFLRDVEIDAQKLGLSRTPERTKDTSDYEVFLSFATPDKEAADHAYSILRRKRLRVFYSPKELKAGDPWEERIRVALMNSREVCVMVSKVSRKREWVLTEWGAAWATGKTMTAILVGCKVSEIPKRLRDRQAIRFDDFEQYARTAAKRARSSSRGR